MHQAPVPEPRELLPPLLACLPTAFASPQPPPALLPLLSPLLRQRVSFLISNGNPRNDGWLPLLSWDGERGKRLPEIVERMELEPHPVSGELEMEDIRPAKYRRLDEETLHAKFEVEQFEILPVYVWCETDEHGLTDAGWKLAELRSIEDTEDGLDWYDTMSEANDAAQSRLSIPQPSGPNGERKASIAGNSDDDYWAAYDRTPNRTPAVQQQSTFQNTQRQRSVSEIEYFARYGNDSPAPQPPSNLSAFQRRHPARQRSQSEFDYFSRYGNEVQPAMDGHDPDEEKIQEAQRTTMNRDSVLDPLPQQPQPPQRTDSRPTGASLFPADANKVEQFPNYHDDIPAPRPISPASSHGSIERLEQRARTMSEAERSQSGEFAQMAIKQHISTDIKSLFRLAKNSGIARSDFERIVKTELDCLSMLEEDED